MHSNQTAEIVKNANVLMQMPMPALRPFVKAFVIVHFPFDRTLKMLPSTNFVAEFRFRGESAFVFHGGSKLPRAAVSGLRSVADTRIYLGGTAILLMMFTELGAVAFLPNPLDAFFNATVALEKVFEHTADLGSLDEQLVTASDNVRRIETAQNFLLEHLRNTRLDPIVSASVAGIEQAGATTRIDKLAREIGLSQSALERRFRRKVGTSPKQFASIVRVINAIRLGARGQDFTSIAHSAGYSDQSHFINDFKRVTGIAPSTFFQQSSICKNAEFIGVAFTSN